MFRFNWAEVLFYAFFLAYGYYGALTPSYKVFSDNFFIGGLSLFVISTSLVIINVILNKFGEVFEDSIAISKKDLLIFLALFIFFLTVANEQLNHAMQGDELSYSTVALGHSISFLLKLPDSISVLGVIPFKYLIQFLSIVLVAVVFTFIYISRKISGITRLAVVLGTLLVFRILIIFLGGNANPHPPLGGLPLLIFGSIGGVSDLSLKLSYFIAFVFFTFILYKICLRIVDWKIALLFASAVGTIPLLLHLATLVENSLWSSICFTLVLAELAVNKKPNLIRLASIVSVLTLMRETSFIGYIPIIIFYFFSSKEKYGQVDWKGLLLILVPSIIFIPFLTQSIFVGTPAIASFGSDHNILIQLFHVLKSNIIFISIGNSIPLWWIFFMPFAFFYFKKDRIHFLAFVTFFFICIGMYYSIRPVLFGLAKYQAEYALPFAIVGALLFLQKLINSRFKKHYVLVLLLIFGFNLIDFMSIPFGNKPTDIAIDTVETDSKAFLSGYRVLCGFTYNYESAFDDVSKQGMMSNSYTVGATYGVLPQIMSGYSFAAIKQLNSIYKNQQRLNKEVGVSWASASVDNVESDSRIKMVVLGAVQKRDELVKNFINHGWVVHSKHLNYNYGSSVIIIKKLGA